MLLPTHTGGLLHAPPRRKARDGYWHYRRSALEVSRLLRLTEGDRRDFGYSVNQVTRGVTGGWDSKVNW